MPTSKPSISSTLPHTNTQSTNQKPYVLSQEIFEHEQLLKFFIGLRLLGELRQQRYLTYLQQLRDKTQPEQ